DLSYEIVLWFAVFPHEVVSQQGSPGGGDEPERLWSGGSTARTADGPDRASGPGPRASRPLVSGGPSFRWPASSAAQASRARVGGVPSLVAAPSKHRARAGADRGVGGVGGGAAPRARNE